MARRTPVRHGRAPFESRPSRRASPHTLHGPARRRVGRTRTPSHWATSSSSSVARPAGSRPHAPADRPTRTIAVATRLASSCFSDDVVTRTIGRSIEASQSGSCPALDRARRARSSAPHRPNRCAGTGTACRSRPASAAPGAETRRSTRPAAHRRSARIALIGGSITFSRRPTTAVRTAASRIRPSAPGQRSQTQPKRRHPGRSQRRRVRRKTRPWDVARASAADRAPQQFTSTSHASGRTRATASARSATSCTARRPNTATDSFSAADGLVAFQSSCWIPSIRGSIASVVKPSLLADLNTGGKCAHMDRVATAGQL